MWGPVNVHIRFRGTIRERSVDPYLALLRWARDKRRVRGVLWDVSSGGGADIPSTDLYLAVKRLAHVKPVVASIGSVAASGGYLATLGARRIYAYRSSIVGSIGVISPHVALRGLLDRLGIEVELLHHGKHKDAYQMIRPLTEEERRKALEAAEPSYRHFVETVALERHRPYEEILPLATGEYWSGEQARHLGLIDAIGDREEALTELSRLSGVPTTRTVQVSPPRGLLQRVLGEPGLALRQAMVQGAREGLEDLLWEGLDSEGAVR
jgi:protease-4